MSANRRVSLDNDADNGLDETGALPEVGAESKPGLATKAARGIGSYFARVFKRSAEVIGVLVVLTVLVCVGGYFVLHSLINSVEHPQQNHQKASAPQVAGGSAAARYVVRNAEAIVEQGAYNRETTPLYKWLSLAVIDTTPAFDSSAKNIELLVQAYPDSTGKGFVVTSQAADGTHYSITVADNGAVSQTCSAPSSASKYDCINGTW